MGKAFLLPMMVLSAALSAGCVGSDDDASPTSTEATSVETPPAAAVPKTEVVEGDIAVSAATPARSFNNGGTFAAPITPKAAITGFVIELTWTASAPVNQKLDLWVRLASAGAVPPADPTELVTGPAAPIAKVTGASPLRVALPAEAFTEKEDYSVIVRAASDAQVGAAANQPFELHITTFKDVAFDPEYTHL